SSVGPRVAPRADDGRRADLLVPDHARREPGALQHGDGAGRLPLPRLGEQVAARREAGRRTGRHAAENGESGAAGGAARPPPAPRRRPSTAARAWWSRASGGSSGISPVGT